MEFTVFRYLHRTNQSVQKLLPTRSSPVLCHKLAKAASVRFRLSIRPAGCEAVTCDAKVNFSASQNENRYLLSPFEMYLPQVAERNWLLLACAASASRIPLRAVC